MLRIGEKVEEGAELRNADCSESVVLRKSKFLCKLIKLGILF